MHDHACKVATLYDKKAQVEHENGFGVYRLEWLVILAAFKSRPLEREADRQNRDVVGGMERGRSDFESAARSKARRCHRLNLPSTRPGVR